MSTTSIKMLYRSLVVSACVVICVSIVIQAQYNTFDSDSNSDSDGNRILTQAELGKLVRNSAKVQAQQNHHRHDQQQLAAATRNLYNRQQPMQYAPTQHRRNYGSADSLNGYGPVMGAVSNDRGTTNLNSESSNDDDDDSVSNAFGSNFGANFDSGNSNDGDGEGNINSEGRTMNLNQAASGYPGHGDYNNDAANAAGFGFGSSNGYGSSADGSGFGPSEDFDSKGRRAKSASSPMSSRNFGLDNDASAPQYGPNSAVNLGERDVDDEGRAGYASENQNENDNDDE